MNDDEDVKFGLYKIVAMASTALLMFILSATYGQKTVRDSCNEKGMFAYSNVAYKCTEIKP